MKIVDSKKRGEFFFKDNFKILTYKDLTPKVVYKNENKESLFVFNKKITEDITDIPPSPLSYYIALGRNLKDFTQSENPLSKKFITEIHKIEYIEHANAIFRFIFHSKLDKHIESKTFFVDTHFEFIDYMIIIFIQQASFTTFFDVINQGKSYQKEEFDSVPYTKAANYDFDLFLQWLFAFKENVTLQTLYSNYLNHKISGFFGAGKEIVKHIPEENRIIDYFLHSRVKIKDGKPFYLRKTILEEGEVTLKYIVDFFWNNFGIDSYSLFNRLIKLENNKLINIKEGKVKSIVKLKELKLNTLEIFFDYIKTGDNEKLYEICKTFSVEREMKCSFCEGSLIYQKNFLSCTQCKRKINLFQKGYKLSKFQAYLLERTQQIHIYNHKIRRFEFIKHTPQEGEYASY